MPASNVAAAAPGGAPRVTFKPVTYVQIDGGRAHVSSFLDHVLRHAPGDVQALVVGPNTYRGLVSPEALPSVREWCRAQGVPVP